MNQCDGPSTVELTKRLEKRLRLAQFPKYDKRYNRSGVNRLPSDGSPDIKGANRLHSDSHGDEVENSNAV